MVIAAMEEERFLILSHPQVQEYMQRKAADRDRWLSGMRRLRDKIYGGVQLHHVRHALILRSREAASRRMSRHLTGIVDRPGQARAHHEGSPTKQSSPPNPSSSAPEYPAGAASRRTGASGGR